MHFIFMNVNNIYKHIDTYKHVKHSYKCIWMFMFLLKSESVFGSGSSKHYWYYLTQYYLFHSKVMGE